MKRHAFTLIELLMVIAIISILAALLFPVFAKAREKARQAACASNLKQIDTALELYTQDFDERLPGRYEGVEYFSWRATTQPYLKSKSLFQCPDINSQKVVLDGTTGEAGNAAGKCFDAQFAPSYAVNGEDDQTKLGGPTPMPSNAGRSLAEFQYPDQLILVTESTYPYAEIPGGFEPDVMFAGHTGRANIAFADGHAKAKKPTHTADPVNMWTIDQSPASPALTAFLASAEANYK